ncbi:hypothetical protein HY637_01050 [Candidatus Woesearchaeota archaeon]|nr:hypothetical protein [Candidatus Woesearchaeota archaeon]
MSNYNHDFKSDKLYTIGINTGFFVAFLLFASLFYLILSFLNKVPQAIRYYHILLFVALTYFIRLLALKFKK